VDDSLLKAPNIRICRVLVEIDIHAGLLESLEIEWRGHLLTQRLDYLGIPFRCSRCRRTGHLHRECRGPVEEDDSEDSFLRRSTREDITEVNSTNGGWFTSTPEPNSPFATRDTFIGKLKNICPLLFASLSALEKDI